MELESCRYLAKIFVDVSVISAYNICNIALLICLDFLTRTESLTAVCQILVILTAFVEKTACNQKLNSYELIASSMVFQDTVFVVQEGDCFCHFFYQPRVSTESLLFHRTHS